MLSCSSEINANCPNGFSEIKEYFSDRISEIEKNIGNKNRSIFDFVNIVVVADALAKVKFVDTTNKEAYIKFLKEIFGSHNSNEEQFLQIFYKCVRCGLVHELATSSNDEYNIILTHNSSIDSKCYSTDSNNNVYFYIPEILKALREYINKLDAKSIKKRCIPIMKLKN